MSYETLIAALREWLRKARRAMSDEFELDERSKKNLKGVDPRLAAVITAAIEQAAQCDPKLKVVVVEGLRTIERQREMVASGASHTMKSKHLTGEAVDVLVNGRYNFPEYQLFNAIVQTCADARNVKITWGGSWTKLVDGPHFQIEG